MNYIIDPSVFYWINTLGIVQTVLAVIGAVILIFALVCLGFYIDSASKIEEPRMPSDREGKWAMDRYKEKMVEYEDDLKIKNQTKRWVILSFIVGSVFVITSIFIPSKQTSIEMLVAKTATYDNVNWSVQQVKEVIDYIVKALKTI